MSNHTVFRVSADVPRDAVNRILNRFPPKWHNIWCQTITHAYRVPQGYGFDADPFEVTAFGYHCGQGHDALVLAINGERFRADGQRYVLALSTADGVMMAEAANIPDGAVKIFGDRLTFHTRWQLRPLWKATSRQAA